ncbi:MAG: plastocyanin/azurin family copper-binding protein [Solirubrobacterales bacterium]
MPILAAEKSKVPFYIAGGLLVAWALIVSAGLGLRRPDFPGGLSGQRAVMAITAVLVLGAVSTAVITSGTAAKAGTASGAASPSSGGGEQPSTPAASTPAASTPAASTPAASTPAASTPAASTPAASAPKTTPKATTGTPAPPSSPAARATSALKLTANPSGQLSFDAKQLSAKAGNVTITLTNTSPLEHDVAVAQGSTVLGTTPTFTGGSKALTLTLKPGTYTFYCSVPGHRQAGMEGRLSIS